jgi:hypothetical protein
MYNKYISFFLFPANPRALCYLPCYLKKIWEPSENDLLKISLQKWNFIWIKFADQFGAKSFKIAKLKLKRTKIVSKSGPTNRLTVLNSTSWVISFFFFFFFSLQKGLADQIVPHNFGITITIISFLWKTKE